MTQIPAGWYPDPAPQTQPGRQRYWDGAGWTEHVHDPQPAPAAPPAAYPVQYPAAQYAATQYPVQYPIEYQPQVAAGLPPTTPDGQALSGWWRRVAAALIDGLIMTPVYVGVLAVFVASRWDTFRTWFEDYSNAVDAGRTPPRPPALVEPYSASMFALAVIFLVIVSAYTLGFWHWKQATPGKLAVGVRIRRREEPGPMPWVTMLLRFLFVQGLALAAYVPYVGLAFVLVSVLDYLWPLWDGKNQALHDKVAGTNVVLAEPRAAGPAPRW